METFIISPTLKQIEAHKTLQENDIVLYGGAIRGSKSFWGCMEITSMCFQYPNSRWLMVRQSLPVLKSTLLVTFTENFLYKGFDKYVKTFNRTDLVLTWNNGSQILFMAESYDSDKELNRFRGLEINGAFIDEVNEIQEVTYSKIIERSGSWFGAGKVPIKILMSCNPTNGWVKSRFYDKWENGTLPKGIAYVQAKITDNPYVPIEYLESLKHLTTYEYMVFVEGNWNVQLKTGGEFYKCFEINQHIKPVRYNPDLALHISWDDNVNPYLPCGVFQIEGGELRMIDEISGITPGNTVKSVCGEFIRRYPGHLSGLFIYGDATANKQDTKLEKGYNFFRLIMDYLAAYRPVNRVLNSNPSVVMRGNWINTVFEKNIGGLNFCIGENCKQAINDFVTLKEAADGTKLKEMATDPQTGARFQKVGHYSDLFEYLCCSAFAGKYEEYQRGGRVASPILGKNISRNDYR